MPTLPFVKEIENLISGTDRKILCMGPTGPYLDVLAMQPALPMAGAGSVLVTGGAGYIGSHTVRELMAQGHDVIVLDDMSSGHESSIKAKLIRADLTDAPAIEKIFTDNHFQAVVHFAGFIRVDESVREPEKYFKNNVTGTLNLVNSMLRHGVRRLVYSSSAAVYGNPVRIPIKEEDECVPTNPYGESKLLVEKIIRYYSQAHGLSAVALRYFNAAGASLDASSGESHPVETHLIPKILEVVSQPGKSFKVFGSDYPTRDGTAVRDYVHVLDLAAVHALALEKTRTTPGAHAYNVGTGKGYSIMQVVQEVLEVTRRMVICEPQPRREGDPAILVADSSRLKSELGYELKHSDLNTIVKTAWEWHKKTVKAAASRERSPGPSAPTA